MTSTNDSKRTRLRQTGAWNSAWEQVSTELFPEAPDFFDPHDRAQVKYEMLRAHYIDRRSISSITHLFGLTRQTFYSVASAFATAGIPGLLGERRGPKKPRKVTPAIIAFLKARRAEQPRLSAPVLAREIDRAFGVTIRPRTLQRHLRAMQMPL